MTQEEKAKAYDEAFEDMRVIYPNLKGDAKLAVEHAFPQLRESEDERIRKEIISALKFANTSDGVYNKHIAYLEKQKEQKPAEWDEKDEKVYDYLKSGFEYASNNPNLLNSVLSGASDATIQDYRNFIDKLKILRPQQTKQEWSEEDRININSILSHLKEYLTDGAYTYYEKWLKALPERFNLEPKQEWNKEDEMMINALLEWLNPDKGGTKYSSYAQLAEWRNWLKSLRPPFKDKEMKLKILKYLSTRCSSLEFEEVEDYLNNLRPSWKPSEEELVALKNAGGILRDYGHSELAKMVFIIEGKLANLAVLNKSIWKPSEEQMEALKCAIEDVAKFSRRVGCQVELENEPYYSALHSLYCDLEKLI